jgi:hypothetical protein
MSRAGYEPVSQSWAEGRPGIGRVFTLGLFAESLRPDGFLTVTYRRSNRAHSASSDPIDQIRRLGELHAEGIISEADFEAKKSELLKRL